MKYLNKVDSQNKSKGDSFGMKFNNSRKNKGISTISQNSDGKLQKSEKQSETFKGMKNQLKILQNKYSNCEGKGKFIKINGNN